ncbi:DNA polymerase IV [Lactobacillus sp.]|uniref:DNA polymerase IV n=1 Tax=Lactobacillus sp. TaxID=1591 RepID=UPI00199584D4|nr:DNA polymerase IV [Lactobacillus sp.]MBD5429975.1 DNA polymerase IV [Lactobacillus sp.]
MLELLPENDTHRKIIHLDMDAFYASVEIRDNPALANKALIIGHDPRKYHGHGVVATANYTARQYGVHSAMPTAKALRLVPEDKVRFVTPNFDKYRAVSQQVHTLMHELTDQVESVALDEAYLDVTENKLNVDSAVVLANKLQQNIYRKTGLTSSFGVSYNKFLAKMGSEYAKPFGRTVILPTEAKAFLAKQKIENFPGIGKKTQEQFHELGIFNGGDLQQLSVRFLIKRFKKMGYAIALHAHGIDTSPVKSDRQRKSIGIERTFESNIHNQNEALTAIRKFSQELSKKLQDQKLTANVIMLKIRSNNFETITKRQKLDKSTNQAIEIFQTAKELYNKTPNFLEDGIRLLGVTGTDLKNKNYEEVTLELFTQDNDLR